MTAAQSTSLAAWLTAQLDADEAAARAAAEHRDLSIASPDGGYDWAWQEGGVGVLAVDPARVLAQVEALRAVVELHTGHHICRDGAAGDRWDDERRDLVDDPCDELRALASIWRGAPGWQEAWE
jgi:hypothetical protein